MRPLAEVHEERHGDVPVGAIHGEIDASNVAEVGLALRGLVSNQSTVLVIDLSATTYLDSAGINLLFALGEEMRGRQQRLAIVVLETSPIARMIALTGLDRTVTTHGTLGAALASAGG